MNKYESIIILKVDLEEEKKNDILTKISKLIKTNGIVEKIEKIGKKKLAYNIKNNTEGDYVLIEFETEKEQILEIERHFRITEEILKFIVVRKDA